MGVIQPAHTGLAAPVQVASSATAVTLKAANSGREGLWIFNDSTAVLHVKFGSGASATDKTVEIASNGFWEHPTTGLMYTGVVTGLWDSANGFCYVTELS